MARAHRALLERLSDNAPTRPATVLGLGAAVVLHGLLEEVWLIERARWLDDAASAELAVEHDRLAEDLDLLDGLLHSEPDSPDVQSLSDAILSRLREHVARDGRVFYQRPNLIRP
ncbi:MAG: hypothetical protein U0Q12_21510 [Vicinamibacterales bacterium]